VFTGIDRLTGLLAAPDFRLHSFHAGPRFPLVVERRHHDMPPLPALRVIAVVTDDEALDAVVVGVNVRHRPRVSPPAVEASVVRSPRGATLSWSG